MLQFTVGSNNPIYSSPSQWEAAWMSLEMHSGPGTAVSVSDLITTHSPHCHHTVPGSEPPSHGSFNGGCNESLSSLSMKSFPPVLQSLFCILSVSLSVQHHIFTPGYVRNAGWDMVAQTSVEQRQLLASHSCNWSTTAAPLDRLKQILPPDILLRCTTRSWLDVTWTRFTSPNITSPKSLQVAVPS